MASTFNRWGLFYAYIISFFIDYKPSGNYIIHIGLRSCMKSYKFKLFQSITTNLSSRVKFQCEFIISFLYLNVTLFLGIKKPVKVNQIPYH